MSAVGHGVGAVASVTFGLSPRGPYPAIKHAGARRWGGVSFSRGVAATILKGLLPLPEVEKRSGGGLSGQGGGCRSGVNLLLRFQGTPTQKQYWIGTGAGAFALREVPKYFAKFFGCVPVDAVVCDECRDLLSCDCICRSAELSKDSPLVTPASCPRASSTPLCFPMPLCESVKRIPADSR